MKAQLEQAEFARDHDVKERRGDNGRSRGWEAREGGQDAVDSADEQVAEYFEEY